MVLSKWTQIGISKFIEYFYNQWLVPPFDTWQLFRTPPGFATIAINESFNKQLKETFTRYKLKSLVHIMKHTLPSVCRFYSQHPNHLLSIQAKYLTEKKLLLKQTT